MSFKVVNTNVNTLDHVKEVVLKDERFPRMIEHASSMFKLGKVFETEANVIGEFK